MPIVNYFTKDDIRNIEKTGWNSRPVYKLSKTSFLKGEQCAKHLYLSKFKKEEKDPLPEATKIRFKEGRNFEASYKSTFLDGIDVTTISPRKFYLNPIFTEKLIQKKCPVIFEATLIYNEVLVMVDVLILNEDGSYSIHEVKDSSEAKEVFLRDLAIQYYVVSNILTSIKEFSLVLNGDNDKPFKVIDFKERAESKLFDIETKVMEYKQILNDFEPNVEMGDHCLIPYKCDFMGYCDKLKG